MGSQVALATQQQWFVFSNLFIYFHATAPHHLPAIAWNCVELAPPFPSFSVLLPGCSQKNTENEKKNPLIWWWHGGAQTAHGTWYLCLYLIVTRVYHGFVVAPNDTNITYKLQSMYPIPCAIHTWLPADDARMKIKNAEKNSNLSQNAMQCHLWCLSTSILFLTHKVRRYFRRRQQAFAHLSPARQDDYSGINQTP